MPKMFSKFKKKSTKSSAISSSVVAVTSPIEKPVPTGCSTLEGSQCILFSELGFGIYQSMFVKLSSSQHVIIEGISAELTSPMNMG